MSESASGPVGWNPKRGPFSDTVLAINFVADAGRLMLESSTSVSEVEDRLHRFLPVVGLDGCALEGTLNSLTLSYWQPGHHRQQRAVWPIRPDLHRHPSGRCRRAAS